MIWEMQLHISIRSAHISMCMQNVLLLILSRLFCFDYNLDHFKILRQMHVVKYKT